MSYKIKKAGNKSAVSNYLLRCLGRAIVILSEKDSYAKEQLASIDEGVEIAVTILPSEKPALVVKKQDGKLVRVKNNKLSADNNCSVLEICFKNLHSATPVIFGKQSVKTAHAQARFIARGDYTIALPFVELVNLAEYYMYPKFMAKKILGEDYQREYGGAKLMFAAVFSRK